MIAIIDYDAGNLRSVEKALLLLGGKPVITRDRELILSADHVILPGVGAFGDAMEKLEHYGLVEVIREVAARNIPLLGICLGMQLLFEGSEEAPGIPGLCLAKGQILRIPSRDGLKIPHMGWNDLTFEHPGRLFADIPEHAYMYFVHSFYLHADNEEIVSTTTEYSVRIHASIEQGSVFGCQFHPEKSSEMGLRLLKNFISV